jgi:hypothetical protein
MGGLIAMELDDSLTRPQEIGEGVGLRNEAAGAFFAVIEKPANQGALFVGDWTA